MTEDTLRIQLQLAKQLCDSIAPKIALLMPHYAMFPKEVAIAQRLFQRDLLSIESVTSFITNRHKLYTISRKLRASHCDSPGTSTDEATASIKSFMEVHVHAPEKSCCHQRAIAKPFRVVQLEKNCNRGMAKLHSQPLLATAGCSQPAAQLAAPWLRIWPRMRQPSWRYSDERNNLLQARGVDDFTNP